MRLFILALCLIPMFVVAQQQDAQNLLTPIPTELLPPKPPGVSLEEWQQLLREPGNASIYPIRLTPAMLDTMDTSKLDMRYSYILVPDTVKTDALLKK